MFTLVFCLQTIKRNESAPRSTAFIVDFTWEVNCTQLCNNYRPITTVQYRRILYGHVVGMMRCDWPSTDGYIINGYISHTVLQSPMQTSPLTIQKQIFATMSKYGRCISAILNCETLVSTTHFSLSYITVLYFVMDFIEEAVQKMWCNFCFKGKQWSVQNMIFGCFC